MLQKQGISDREGTQHSFKDQDIDRENAWRISHVAFIIIVINYYYYY